ncbi:MULTISPECIES: bacterioferritin comigratory protein [Vibrio]|uniref:Bacterioferritin comigratory protein n=2 Tax=Vibrio TaxID=662 RepID=A0A4U1Z110_9VIBR|nr:MULTISPECIES: bacterioferritin comigratory protein [Vibrio]NAW80390.1 bacterioferritin comigratory protein [Vibrio sp. V33_P6A3T137]QKE34904.1 bacterioferritin comigratory protein [Vibrio fluvialis]TKF27192.1 bacterioferritin comigratory protein [Vibrio kanaloae]TYC92226.1 bacterioferritin comigratory protein [Vibrio anguillarum]TYC95461.1 bacterioferritin comigratory protein [Vibrio anguillarum]
MTQATKNKLIKALERLLEGKPENRELRKKAREGKLKINNSTVEKEAGLSVGALRRHEDIRDMVKDKSLKARVAQDDSSESPIDLLQSEIKQLKNDKTQANKKRKEYLDLSRSHEQALAVQAANHIKIVQELMEMLHESEREKAMDKVVKARPDNLIQGDFR